MTTPIDVTSLSDADLIAMRFDVSRAKRPEEKALLIELDKEFQKRYKARMN